MSLLKQCCHILAPVITDIVNLSLSTGVFPSQFKQAIITPLIKKPSLDREFMSNYRPIYLQPLLPLQAHRTNHQRPSASSSCFRHHVQLLPISLHKVPLDRNHSPHPARSSHQFHGPTAGHWAHST